ncbi:MAG TPA: HAMP domain-containing protein, partial [Alkalispirochaeta sp.]|nr:HAMP domain-containing protein [Alkalispirochaeta sp.]
MRIRLKIVLVVLPLLLVTLVLSGASAVFSSTNGITRVAQEFLDFKAGELQKHAESQWALLVDNGFTNRSDMVSATQAGIMSFADSLIRTDTEMIIAVSERGVVESSTLPFDGADPDQQSLARIFEQRDTSLLNVQLGGEERIGKGFYFAPFDLFYLVTETRDVFYRDVDRIIRESAIILAAASLISVLMLLIFSSQLTRPITNIVTSMRRIISSNDLSERVPVQFNDETGDLAHTFNIMIGELDRAYQQI